MVEPFGDQDGDAGLGKRPARTIEGTATEVSVEPASAEAEPASAEAAARAFVAATASADETAAGEPPLEDAGSPTAAEDFPSDQDPIRKSPPPRTSPLELRSFFTHLAAGVLGGLIGVLGLAFAWGPSRPNTAGPVADLSGLERRLGQLEAQPSAPAGDAKALAALDKRLKIVEQLAPKSDADLPDRVAKLQASIDALAKSAESGGSVADAAALEARIGEIEQRLDGKIESALGAQDAAHGKSLEAVEAEIASLKAKLGALAEANLEAEETNTGPEVAALGQRLAKLETAVPNLAKAVDRGSASAKSGAAAIAFANLREAVDAGRPYTPELAALNALAPKLGNLGVLSARADSGIPTVPALAEALRLQAAQASASAAPEQTDASFIDSVIASAKSAVRVRRVDDAATGSEPEAVLARAQAQVEKGELAAAVENVQALPAPWRQALAPWLESANARLSADATLVKLQATLLSSIGGSAAEAKP